MAEPRILLLTDCFPKPTIPNLGVWALQQARALAAAGADVRVVSPTSWVPPLLRNRPAARRFNECPAEYEYDGIPVRYPRWPFYSAERILRFYYGRPGPVCRLAWWFLQPALARAVRDWRPDVVFAHHTVPCGMMALRMRERFGLPFIVEDFDYGSIEACRRFPGRRRAFARVSRGASVMAGASRRLCDTLAELIPGVNSVPLHTGTHHLPAALAQTPRPPEIEGKQVIFSASGFYERKGMPLLIEAFAGVAPRFPNAVLRIAGDGRERPAVEAAIARTHLADRIQMLGIVPHERILQEMVWSDLFMLIGWDEPFATVYLEAMSAGKPIICCNDGGICDVLENGIQGLAVPPRDVPAAAAALERLLGDDAARLGMGRAAADLFQRRLTFAAAAEATLVLLRRAAGWDPVNHPVNGAPDEPNPKIP